MYTSLHYKDTTFFICYGLFKNKKGFGVKMPKPFYVRFKTDITFSGL